MISGNSSADAVAQLSDQCATRLMVRLGLDVGAKSAFLDIIIELLPFLADLLGKNCAPDGASGLQFLIKDRGWRGRLFRYRYHAKYEREVRDRDMRSDEYDAWGRDLSYVILEVVGDANNLQLVDAAMNAPPPPRWGTFGVTSVVLLIAAMLLLSAPPQATAQWYRDGYGRLRDSDGAYIVPARHWASIVSVPRWMPESPRVPARYWVPSTMPARRTFGGWPTRSAYPLRSLIFNGLPNCGPSG